MTTNPLLTRRAAPAREAVPIETMVARWNAELKRDDVEWIIGHDGKPHLVTAPLISTVVWIKSSREA